MYIMSNIKKNTLMPVILHTEASDGWGGQEIRIFNEMSGMRDRGYGILLAAPAHSTIYRKATEAGFETFAVPMNRASFIPGVLFLYRLIKARSVSLINTHSSRDHWVGSIAGRLSGIKVIKTRHISSRFNRSAFTRLAYKGLCDAIISTGEYIRERLRVELGVRSEKVHSVPTGISVERFGSGRRDHVRDEFDIASDVKIIGIAAVLRSWKGHIYILRALSLLLKDFPGVRLMFVGDGPYRPSIEEEIARLGLGGQVILAGHRDDMEDVISAFDIAVMASYESEGVPQFALQAMASGKPMVGAISGGIPEVIQDGVTGLLVPPKDPEAMAAAFKKLLSTEGLAEKMGDAGREVVISNFSFEGMLDKIEGIYAGLLSPSSSGVAMGHAAGSRT